MNSDSNLYKIYHGINTSKYNAANIARTFDVTTICSDVLVVLSGGILEMVVKHVVFGSVGQPGGKRGSRQQAERVAWLSKLNIEADSSVETQGLA